MGAHYATQGTGKIPIVKVYIIDQIGAGIGRAFKVVSKRFDVLSLHHTVKEQQLGKNMYSKLH